MLQIELSQDDMDMLREILQTHLSELSFEIAFTHNRDYVKVLRKRRDFMESLVRRLEMESRRGSTDQAGPERIREGELMH